MGLTYKEISNKIRNSHAMLGASKHNSEVYRQQQYDIYYDSQRMFYFAVGVSSGAKSVIKKTYFPSYADAQAYAEFEIEKWHRKNEFG